MVNIMPTLFHCADLLYTLIATFIKFFVMLVIELLIAKSVVAGIFELSSTVSLQVVSFVLATAHK